MGWHLALDPFRGLAVAREDGAGVLLVVVRWAGTLTLAGVICAPLADAPKDGRNASRAGGRSDGRAVDGWDQVDSVDTAAPLASRLLPAPAAAQCAGIHATLRPSP